MTVVGRQGDQTLTNEAGEVTSHLQGMFTRTIRMLEAGIKPVYVFDGKPPEMKSGELAKRKEKRVDADAKLEAAKEAAEKAEDEDAAAEQLAEVEKYSKRTVRVTTEHNEECKRLLRLMGMPVVEAPCEAEATCAALCKAGKVYAVGSEDMDTLTFGAPKLARNLMAPSSQGRPILEYDYAATLQGLELEPTQFVDLCILCGCDYTDSIRNMGPVKALKGVKQFGNIEGILADIKGKKTNMEVPEEWNFTGARQLFVEPDVTDASSLEEFKWNTPDEQGLIDFLVKEKSFQQERVEKGVAKIKSAKSKGQQNRLESFFGAATTHSSTMAKKRPEPASKGKGAPAAKRAKGVGKGVGGGKK
eukprot:CAMPEP_0170158780 /NCGR_PEP_ID=MMETSP0033_2-20121228/69098_1 /TAXON_ID=195969 /ORGANISM="Dolichomastix tenuilepis, Strain CCMP3274" /LENGTH=359 /DNA_ID=CAMNT_0010396235 /DNA_START=39 /DNA_END=1118 /DNA_ORIENTATION=+